MMMIMFTYVVRKIIEDSRYEITEHLSKHGYIVNRKFHRNVYPQ